MNQECRNSVHIPDVSCPESDLCNTVLGGDEKRAKKKKKRIVKRSMLAVEAVEQEMV